MIVIATGGRNFADREYVYRVLDRINSVFLIEYAIHGGCQVADSESEEWVNSGADWFFHDWCLDHDIGVHIESGAPYFKKYGNAEDTYEMNECAKLEFRV